MNKKFLISIAFVTIGILFPIVGHAHQGLHSWGDFNIGATTRTGVVTSDSVEIITSLSWMYSAVDFRDEKGVNTPDGKITGDLEKQDWALVAGEITKNGDVFQNDGGFFVEVLEGESFDKGISVQKKSLSPVVTVPAGDTAGASEWKLTFNGLGPEGKKYVAVMYGVDKDGEKHYGKSVSFTTSNIDKTLDPTDNESDPYRTGDAPAPDAEVLGCTNLTNFSLETCIFRFVNLILYEPTAWLARISGKILDFFVYYSLQSSSYNQSSFIEEGWRVTRDISNLAFIFVLLWTAISTITGLGASDAKRALGMVIVVAVLINFSLFFSKIIIDAGNILGRVMYNSIETVVKDSGGEIVQSSSGEKQISASIVAQFNPQKLMALRNKADFSLAYGLVIVLIGFLINLVIIYCFLSVAFLFVARIIGLWIAMIFSPFAFISLTLPSAIRKGMGEYGWDGWLGNISSLAFMAPVYAFFMYLILMFANVKNLITFSESDDITIKIIAVIVPLAIIIGLLLKAKGLAVQMSGEIGKMVNEYAGKATGIAAGAAVGTAAFIGRNTAGRLANYAVENEKVKDWADRNGRFGKFALKSLDTTRKAGFDARNTAAGSSITKQTGINFDSKILGVVGADTKSTKGGYVQKQEDKKKSDEDYKKLITTDKTDEEIRGSYTEKEIKEREVYDEGMDNKLKERWSAKPGNTNKTDEDWEKYKKGKKTKEEYEKSQTAYKKTTPPPPVYLTAAERNTARTEKYAEYKEKKSGGPFAIKDFYDKDGNLVKKKGEVCRDPYAEKDLYDADGKPIARKGEEIAKKNMRQFFKVLTEGLLKGAASGAVVGSIVPGIGTIAGATGGAVLGAIREVCDYSGTTNKKIALKVRSEKKKKDKLIDELIGELKEDEPKKDDTPPPTPPPLNTNQGQNRTP